MQRREIIHRRFSRRIALILAGRGLLSAAVFSQLNLDWSSEAFAAPAPGAKPGIRTFSQIERAILSVVQEHLLPSEPDSPGARTIGATQYLEAAIMGSDVNPGDFSEIRRGITTLQAIGKHKFNAAITALSTEQLENTLRAFESTDAGDEWLTLVMGYTIEAYVGDPAYGGNPDGIVWRWLGHTPGFPRPVSISPEQRR